MKTRDLLFALMWSVTAFGQEFDADPNAASVPPLSEPAERSVDELEKLVAPMALYPDPLIAVMLPAAVYPVEIVQAARFVSNPNNVGVIDAQPWDDNVKELARFPTVIQYMSDNLDWTVELGEAFTQQSMDLMDAIQTLRTRAQATGTLQSSPEQNVVVTNAIVERTYENQIVYVTNTVVQIVPADPQVIHVPVYNPSVVFAPTPVVVPGRPFVTFHAGIPAGRMMANNRVNWWYGGVYYGPGSFVVWNPGFGRHPFFPAPPGFRPPMFRPPIGWVRPWPGYRPVGLPPRGMMVSRGGPGPMRWRADPRRVRMSGSRAIASRDNRGWAVNRPATIAPINRPRLSPTGRPGPGSSRSAPGPARMRTSNSGLSDMNSSGSQSRDSSRRGASSRRGIGPRGRFGR